MTIQEIYNYVNKTGNKFFFPEDMNGFVFDANCYDGWESDNVDCYDYFTGELVRTMSKDDFVREYGEVTTFLDALENKPFFYNRKLSLK